MTRCTVAALVAVACTASATVADAAGPQESAAISAEANSTDALVKRYPFRESSLAWFQSLGAMGLVKSSQLSWEPYYDWLWRISPRYYFTDKLSLRLKVGLDIEWTNSSGTSTTTVREPNWEDIWVDLVYSPVWTIPRAKIEITPSLRLVIPTSKLARAETQYIGIGPGFALSRTFHLPRRMSLELYYAFRYIKNLNQYTTVQFQGQPLAGCAATPDSGDCGAGLQSGESAVSHEFINMLSADLKVTGKLTFEVFAAFFNYLTYGVPDVTVPLAGGATVTLGPDPTMDVNHRATIWYEISADYQIHPVIGIGLAVSSWTPQLGPDSTYNLPFINRYAQFVLTTTVALDHVVANIERAVRSRRGRPAAGHR